MKIKMIRNFDDFYLLNFEDEINEFIKDKKVIDIKYQYTDFASAMILYKE